jgi:TerC family integral membrane protein
MRVIMIFAGVALINRFGWVLYIFGAFLIFTGLKMIFTKTEEVHPEHNPIVRWFRRVVPVANAHHDDKLIVRVDGRLMATPLMVVLVCVEVTDVIFAIDSIPAIFAVTLDPFIIYTSNVFAIMGLRSLYFVLGGMMLPLHLYPDVVQRIAALTPFPVLLAAPASFVFGAGMVAPGELAARLALWCGVIALGMRWTFTRAAAGLTINGG